VSQIHHQSLDAHELEALRKQLERQLDKPPVRFDADPEDVQRSVAKLVLSLVEFLRQLLERQAIRRMEEQTLAADEVEALGLALMKLEQTVHELADRFGLRPEDLHLDLGPIGRLS
jgi:hypothetical protein